MDTKANKEAFAAALLKAGDPFVAGRTVFPKKEDIGLALEAAMYWVNDPVVQSAKAEIVEEKGSAALVVSKEEYARKIWEYATNTLTNGRFIDTESQLKAMELFGKVMGYIEKPQAGNVTNFVSNKVMIVPASANDEAWEAKLLKQQRALTSDATYTVN